MKAPIAKKRAHQFNEHNIKRTDNYFWLREKTNQGVLDYVDAENDFTDYSLSHTEPLQDDLFQEMKARIKEDDSSVPYFKNGYWYYIRYEEGDEYALYCRKKDSLEAKEEILLFVFITLMLIYFSAVGIYYFENEAQPEYFTSIFDSLWWAIITLTTVGYGDVYPITAGGKVFTFFILMIGLGIVAIPTGIISSALTRSVDKKE